MDPGLCFRHALVAQGIEHRFPKPGVASSNLAEGAALHHDKLDDPLRWKKPRIVFVNSMSDLFHQEIPDSFIWSVFATMREAAQHTFQVLTKRPQRAQQGETWFHPAPTF